MFAQHYSKFYDLFNHDKPYKKEIEMIYKWSGYPKTVFDIGCGTANYWKYYPDRVQLMGIEKSEKMIKQSKYKKHIIHGDIATYKVPEYSDIWLAPYFDLATAIFDVINYIPDHKWWKNLPLTRGDQFIFDILDKKKVDKEGFTHTQKFLGDVGREIFPASYDGKVANLDIYFYANGIVYLEHHKLYMYSVDDIKKFCGKEFEIVDIKPTEKWQTWYKLVRK